jgi:tetratricopeptide (TPR) repeat protein
MSCYYQDRFEVITSYVQGDLPENEQEAFEAHYLGCDECFRALHYVEKTTQTMHHFGDSIFAPAPAHAKRAWSEWLENLKTWWDELYVPESWKRAAPALAAYILLVAAMSVGYYWMTSSPSSQMDRESGFFVHPHAGKTAPLAKLEHLDWSMASLDNSILLSQLAEVERIYQDQRDYPLAEARLARIAKDFPNLADIRLYLGVSQLLEKKTSEGIKSLRQALKLNPQHSAIQWYLAQGDLIQGHASEARTLLTSLADRRDPQYGQKAATLVEAINKLGKLD